MLVQDTSNYRISPEHVRRFEAQGFVVIDDLIDAVEVARLCDVYERFLAGTIDGRIRRNDLGGHATRAKKDVENVTHIMWPSDTMPSLLDGLYHRRAIDVARQLLGDDVDFDFDMMIDKAPHTNTATPWHQDASYWPDMPDARAATCWLALDPATVDNGCMWFVPGSHRAPLREHWRAGEGSGALECRASEDEATVVPLSPGSCTFHHGGTIHYSRGNTTGTRRRAFIVNCRPEAMIRYERERGFDHGRTSGPIGREIGAK
jgi:phytanoyl-CoA hydroxylase